MVLEKNGTWWWSVQAKRGDGAPRVRPKRGDGAPRVQPKRGDGAPRMWQIHAQIHAQSTHKSTHPCGVTEHPEWLQKLRTSVGDAPCSLRSHAPPKVGATSLRSDGASANPVLCLRVAPLFGARDGRVAPASCVFGSSFPALCWCWSFWGCPV